MHIHTTAGASDGGLSLEDLADEAKQRGLTGINITETNGSGTPTS